MICEFRACLNGLRFYAKLGLCGVIFESDSATLVNLLNEKKIGHHTLQRRWLELKSLFSNVLFCVHQFREANCIADKLANMGAIAGTYFEFFLSRLFTKTFKVALD